MPEPCPNCGSEDRIWIYGEDFKRCINCGKPIIVKVYSAPDCPYCDKAKKFLMEKNIRFVEIDVTKDKAGMDEMLSKTQQNAVPVIDMGWGDIIIGFNKEKIMDVWRGLRK